MQKVDYLIYLNQPKGASDIMDNLTTFQERLYKDNHRYIFSIAYILLDDKGFADAVTRLTFHKAFHRKFNLSPDPRIWLLSDVTKITDKCNELTGGKEVNADD